MGIITLSNGIGKEMGKRKRLEILILFIPGMP
jgi:hypothetical protein